MTLPTKLLVLGIDAASPSLLKHWAAEGKLPVLRSLLDRGTSGIVHGVSGFYIGSTWPSLYTGLNPASHGFHRIEQLECGTYRFFRPLDRPTGVGGVPFWKLASNAGRRVAVMDVPLTRVDRRLNGLQVVEWGGHDAVFGFNASTPEVERRIVAKVGAYPLPSNCDANRRTPADFDAFVTRLETAAAKKAEITLDLLAREDWDLFMQVFTESHCAGHQCWHLHDPTHPAHDAAVAAEIGDPLERAYRAIDSAVGAILEQARDARVLLISAHGMGPYRGAQFLLPEILFRLGVTARPPALRRSLKQRLGTAARAAVRSALPAPARRALRAVRGRVGARDERLRPAELGADAAHSRCFPVPNGAPIGGIRLNLVGREPQGVLLPGAEADAFCTELARDLCAIVDERTGRPLVASVHRTAELYAGARLDTLPDLLVEWQGEPATGSLALAGGRGATIRAASEKIGIVEGSNRYGRSGEHLPEGFFVYVGPGVAHGERPGGVSVTDFHATLCRLMGLDEPEVDGAVIPEIAAA